ncbi:MAG: energy-coupling factor ABC transporter ATP-binding protein [Thermacetogeniaceae bacterium]
MKSDAILETRGLCFSYVDGTQALSDVSISIPAGKKVAFLGPNGAGKTTLFLHFNGLIRPDRGRIYFAGREVRYDHASLLELRKRVGIVFQDPETQLFSASVKQEISFGPLNLGLPRETVIQRVHKAMRDTGILDLQNKPTHFLSYGQKKRVAIADVLAMEPEVLICDEPTAWLDVRHSEEIMKLLAEINKKGVTVIISTHDVEMAYSWADYIFVMKAGRVIGEAPPEAIFRDKGLLKEAELQRPWLLELYEELERKGWLRGGVPPRDFREFLRRIRDAGPNGSF